MTDLDSQNPFVPQMPPGSKTQTAEPERTKRRKAAKAVAAPKAPRKVRQSSGIPLTAPAGEKGSKVRKPRAAKAAPVPTGKLDISTIVTAAVGLKEDEATVLLAIVQSLGHLKKSAKPKVLAALAKLFG